MCIVHYSRQMVVQELEGTSVKPRQRPKSQAVLGSSLTPSNKKIAAISTDVVPRPRPVANSHSQTSTGSSGMPPALFHPLSSSLPPYYSPLRWVTNSQSAANTGSIGYVSCSPSHPPPVWPCNTSLLFLFIFFKSVLSLAIMKQYLHTFRAYSSN